MLRPSSWVAIARDLCVSFRIRSIPLKCLALFVGTPCGIDHLLVAPESFSPALVVSADSSEENCFLFFGEHDSLARA